MFTYLMVALGVAGGVGLGPAVQRLRHHAATRLDLAEKARMLRHGRRCWLCNHRMSYSTCCCHEPIGDSDRVGSGY